MSIVFINPLWLWGILPVVLIGLAALGYGHHRKIIFPALDFFPPQVKPGLAGRTGIDWLWLLVFIGALLAALAPAGMQVQFKSPSAPPPVRLFAVGRALPGTATADLWIKSRSPLSASHYRLTVQAGGKTLVFTLSGWRLMHGCTCSGIPAAPSMQLTLATGSQVFARKTLLRQPAPTPFNIDLIGQISPALVRLLRLMPGVHWNQPRTLPTITLIERNGDATSYSPNSTVIALGRTPAPNMTVGRIVNMPAGSTVAIDQPTNPLFRHVSLATVHVKQLFVARLGPSWRILASIGGQPWLAERISPRTHIHWFWLASPPRDRFTDWQHHVSFVIFFANLVRQTVGASGGPSGVQTTDTWWRAAEPSTGLPQISPASTASYALSPLLGLLSAVLVTLAAVGLVRRYK